MSQRILTVVCLAGFVAPLLTHAQSPASGAGVERGRVIAEIPYTDASVDIDGALDDEIWNDALMLQLDVETNPGENVPAPVATDAYLIQNGSALLVAFDAMDPDPEAIRAYLRDRDTAFNDDFVGIVVDTFNDERRAFEFFVNALGVQMDLTQDDVNRREDASWNAIWESAGVIHDAGYTVEMAIPFSQLRFPTPDGMQTWGIDVLRFYPRQDRSRLSINPLSRARNCYLCQLAKVRGFAEAEPGKDLEVVPSLTASRTDEHDAATGRMSAGDSETEVGLNVRWGITPSLTANLAVNPDFSQVEADVAQLDINNQFALFFPETRPFFLEGADFFSTPINAVFTRTVADPDLGGKMTGTIGNNIFGTFVAEDAVTNLLFPGPLNSSNDTLELSSRAFVGRFRRSLGESSTLGALFTSRSADDYHNTVAGIDGRFRVNDKHSISFQYLDSDTAYPEGVGLGFAERSESFGGYASRIQYGYDTRNWFANFRHESLEPGFRADLGFVSRVDIDQQNVGFGRVWHGDEDNWWNRLQLGANSGTTSDTAGRLLGRSRELFFAMQGPFQSFVQTGAFKGQQFWDGTLFDNDGIFIFGQVRPRGGLTFGLNGRIGDQIDFANSRLGHQTRMVPSVDWNVNRHLLLRLQHTVSRLETPAGATIFDADLTDLRLTWQFNVRSFLRLTLQRELIERNLAVFEDPDAEPRSLSVASQLLYSYQVNPQTVIFAGYADNNLENSAFQDLTKTDRTVFVKLSYAWTP